MKHFSFAAILPSITAFAICLSASAANASILGQYYVAAGNNNRVLHGTMPVNAWNPQVNGEFAIAVFGGPVNRVRTLTSGPTLPASGSEYTLDGTFTGTTYTHPLGMNEDLFDATTDGVSIYSWDWTNGRAYRLDADWSNPSLLFELPVGDNEDRRLGITYDKTNDSLWLSGWSGASGNTIENRSMDGTLLSSFTVSHNRNAALALDPFDDTFWIFDRNTWFTTPTFEQYSKDGNYLSSLTFPDLIGLNMLGGEFAPVVIPEPTTLAVWSLLGAIGLVVSRRGRRQSERISSS